jgi:glycine dehydrogenase
MSENNAAHAPYPSHSSHSFFEEHFADRHIGPRSDDARKMLAELGLTDVDELLGQVVPEAIRLRSPLAIAPALSESDAVALLRMRALKNRVTTSMIGLGYANTITPPVILRNILENPAWYTAYTPYQPEISQGRLEALLNFQTMVADLTGMDLASASLLDEATAAAEAMGLARRQSKSLSSRFLVDSGCHPQVIDVVRTRAEPLGLEVVLCGSGEIASAANDGAFGALLAFPASTGELTDHRKAIAAVQSAGGLVCATTDLLACVLVEPPGSFGVDMVVGSAQRFGVPLGFGGPHAGFLAVRDAHKRAIPGRLVGVSVDTKGRRAMRLALQTREQHIRREKATSNICTAQVLLAVMAGMYACYHGPDGLKRIAGKVASDTNRLAASIQLAGAQVVNTTWFDTLCVRTFSSADSVVAAALNAGVNVRKIDAQTVSISCDETTTDANLLAVAQAFGAKTLVDAAQGGIPTALLRTTPFMTHPVFSAYQSETEMLRYLRRLADKDLALDRTMIPLGSCTMKLNATSEMIPVTWPEFGSIHPFAPRDQAIGYLEMIRELEEMLVEITGYDAVSLQPNAGSQGEFAGLLAIRAYHRSRGDVHRNVCLIPSSAHGTNAASAAMCGMKVVVVGCDDNGNVDMMDLRSKIEQHRDQLGALMVTYPSTHGVFEETIVEICDLIHASGGQVYLDGANFNALVGVAKPGKFGADVSHLNLHKTFCIPHGGGGPGVGPVCVRSHLAPFLPGHPMLEGASSSMSETKTTSVGSLTSAPYGSAGILPIPWMYITMMGPDGLRAATVMAILSANYIAHRLDPHFPVLYQGRNGRVAHECIIDIRPITAATGVSVDDVAKRLIDYGFHAPTMSFPVAGTLMIEPTESESVAELDRFCEAMIAIRAEIDEIGTNGWTVEDNPLANAPHTAEDVTADDWAHPYPRSRAAYPVEYLRAAKYWPPVSRIDGAYGDRNVVCSCPPLDSYS